MPWWICLCLHALVDVLSRLAFCHPHNPLLIFIWICLCSPFSTVGASRSHRCSNFLCKGETAGNSYLQVRRSPSYTHTALSLAYSWELGIATEALLELDEPELSVYGESPFPPPYALPKDSPIVMIAKKCVSIFSTEQWLNEFDCSIVDNKPNNTQALMTDDAAGDPASNGIAVILAGMTWGQDRRFPADAEDQLSHLLCEVPRAPNGAISHRESEAQLWGDFVDMAPPFIAYYGAFSLNKSLVEEGANQVRLYREVLQDPVTKLWRHILLGSWSEPSLWGTGEPEPLTDLRAAGFPCTNIVFVGNRYKHLGYRTSEARLMKS